MVTHWLLVPGDCGSNSGGGEKLTSFVFESRSHDCCYTQEAITKKCMLTLVFGRFVSEAMVYLRKIDLVFVWAVRSDSMILNTFWIKKNFG